MIGSDGIIASMPFFVGLIALVGVSSALFVLSDQLQNAPEGGTEKKPGARGKGVVIAGVLASLGLGVILYAGQTQSRREALASRLGALESASNTSASSEDGENGDDTNVSDTAATRSSYNSSLTPDPTYSANEMLTNGTGY